MGKYFDPNICISGIIYNFAFDLEKFISKIWKNILFCSRIIALYVYVNVFSKCHPGCHNIVNGIKHGSN